MIIECLIYSCILLSFNMELLKYLCRIVFLVEILFCCANCSAQNNDAESNKSVYFETGKSSLIYCLYFDYKFPQKKFGVRLGGGSNFAKYMRASTAGGGAYYLAGNIKNNLELGLDLHYLNIDEISDDQRGFALVYPDHSISTYYVTTNIGYRHNAKHSLFRIGFAPGFIKNDFVPGGYFSFGIRF
jgi:hypothetical protein